MREVSLKNKEQYFKDLYSKAFAHNPKNEGMVPILVHGDKIIAESDLIAWYLA